MKRFIKISNNKFFLFLILIYYRKIYLIHKNCSINLIWNKFCSIFFIYRNLCSIFLIFFEFNIKIKIKLILFMIKTMNLLLKKYIFFTYKKNFYHFQKSYYFFFKMSLNYYLKDKWCKKKLNWNIIYENFYVNY